MRQITNPLTNTLAPIAQVLRDLAGRDTYNEKPHDQLIEAAQYIEELEAVVHHHRTQPGPINEMTHCSVCEKQLVRDRGTWFSYICPDPDCLSNGGRKSFS